MTLNRCLVRQGYGGQEIVKSVTSLNREDARGSHEDRPASRRRQPIEQSAGSPSSFLCDSRTDLFYFVYIEGAARLRWVRRHLLKSCAVLWTARNCLHEDENGTQLDRSGELNPQRRRIRRWCEDLSGHWDGSSRYGQHGDSAKGRGEIRN